MSVEWTQEQRKVIETRNRNILVSAAAGSGKTAVLVERIIRRLTEEHPVSVDQLLIVTFTEAAASEMKERIREALERKLEEHPENGHLEQQATLIHSAAITTIHSFCLSVIRDHFHVIGIDPGFRIAEEGELKLLKEDVLDELLEDCYAEGDKEFLAFVDRYGSGRSDRKAGELILKLYEYSRSYPQPEKWLDSCVDAYRYGTEETRLDLASRAVCQARMRMEDMCRMLEKGRRMCEAPDGPYMYGDMLESDLEGMERLKEAEDLDRMYELVQGFVWKRLSPKKDETVSAEKKEQVKRLREQVKKLFQDMRESYFYAPRKEWQKEMEKTCPSMEMLSRLVKRFSDMLRDRKQSRNLIDFSDMEQFALAILTEEQDGRLVPSTVAAEYQERFEEVMIDEYQDSNLVQETILNSVSRMSRGRNNIFMVGDVKQSIYSFRLSRPELFMEKYETYSLTDSETQRIDLHKNFRSRPEVLNSVNYIFRQIMARELGGIEYDDSAALYPGAQFPPFSDAEAFPEFTDRTELLLYCPDTEEVSQVQEGKGQESSRKTEARMIAGRIRELMQTGAVVDRDSGTYRKIRYRDIVILTRSVKGWAEDFTSVLTEEGIPAHSVSREGYFETYEVSVLLDYLKLLDNFRQDLPLTAVLTSPFGNMSAEDLAEIRIAFPDLPFYQAVTEYAAPEYHPADGGGIRRQEQLRNVLCRISYFRERVSYTPVHELLTEIIETTGFDIYITAMPGGAQRMANVEMLEEKAAAFEKTSYKGLFHFVRYIEQLKKYDVDYGEAGIFDEQADTVRIMSIHKSKGLEFPVVFVAGMGKRFNMQDTKGSVILHPEWGAGLDHIDLERRTKTPTFLKKIIREESCLETLSEEMRILYVAMTRAKEKLILTGCADHREAEAVIGERGEFRTAGARTYLDWVLPALLSEGTGTIRQDAPVDVRFFTGKDLEAGKAVERTTEQVALDVLTHWDVKKTFVPELEKQLTEQMDYVYPYAAQESMKLKFTVSELKKHSVLSEEAGEEMYREPETVPLLPGFLQREEELTGASRGSAYHKLLELLDFTVDYDETSLPEAVEDLLRAGRIPREMAECIRPGDILEFLRCESGRRMRKAAREGVLFKEQPFVLSMDAEELYSKSSLAADAGEKILVQGIIDVYFEEPDGLIVLDYKTDRVKSADELKEKYHAQLDYYARALTQLTEKPVKEKIIYSFTLREEIKV